MRHRANPKFWRFYAELPENIQHLAKENYKILKRDTYHPSLHFKKWEGSGEFKQVFIIGLPLSKTVKRLSDFGLVIIASMTGF